MGWAHDGAVTSSAVKTATVTRAGGLGGEELESAIACCVDEVPGPTAAVPGRVRLLQSPGWVQLWQSPSRLPKSPGRLPGPRSRIRLRRGQAARI